MSLCSQWRGSAFDAGAAEPAVRAARARAAVARHGAGGRAAFASGRRCRTRTSPVPPDRRRRDRRRAHRHPVSGMEWSGDGSQFFGGRQHAGRAAGHRRHGTGLRCRVRPAFCRAVDCSDDGGRGRRRRQARQAGRRAPDLHHRSVSLPRSAGRRSSRADRGTATAVRQKSRALPALCRLPSRPCATVGCHRPRVDRSGNPQLPRCADAPRAMSTLLDVRALKTFFQVEGGEFPAVDGISFSIEPGRTLGIVGESGCGKSVTALSIMGLVPQPPGRMAGGQILFDGVDLLQLSAAALRELRGDRISMIFQEPMTSLNPVLTVGEQIVEGILRHRPMSREAAKDRALDMLRMVHIPSPEERFHDYPYRLSGGMRQRVMIAMALSCKPQLLIADEPTTALDVTIQAQILDLMRSLRAETGTAIILITHDLGVVAELADDVVVMYAGRIVERATVAALFAEPQHPYTVGLLGSIPRLDIEQDRLAAIEGQVPNPLAPVAGGRFHPRCPFAIDRCPREDAPLLDLGHGHESACWRAPLTEETAAE